MRCGGGGRTGVGNYEHPNSFWGGRRAMLDPPIASYARMNFFQLRPAPSCFCFGARWRRTLAPFFPGRCGGVLVVSISTGSCEAQCRVGDRARIRPHREYQGCDPAISPRVTRGFPPKYYMCGAI